ncbi:MAG: hypothetical protein F6K19_35060 [Cyanothece sp. SIO1E1]|nr:hypothetical protein [Cyanothece sp. SIO1E1]
MSDHSTEETDEMKYYTVWFRFPEDESSTLTCEHLIVRARSREESYQKAIAQLERLTSKAGQWELLITSRRSELEAVS